MGAYRFLNPETFAPAPAPRLQCEAMAETKIRPMRDEDRPAVRAVVRRAFPVLLRSSFGFASHTIVAERPAQDGKRTIAGGAVLKLFSLPSGRRAGVVSWIFVDPEYQRLGCGDKLVESGLSFLEAQGCVEVFASIAADNTSSSRLFHARGFSPLTPGELFDSYGLGAFRVIGHTQHVFNTGYSLWRRPPQQSVPRPVLQFLTTLVLHLPVVVLYLLRQTTLRGFDAAMAYRLGAVVAGFIALRTGVSWISARAAGISLRYRMWESGFPLGALVAVAFGVLMPVPGSLYPKERGWIYGEWARTLAGVSAVGLVVTSAAGLIAVFLSGSGVSAAFLAWLIWVRRVSVAFLLVDGVLPIFPFDAYAANRIRRFSLPLWVVCAALSLSVSIYIWI